MWKKTGGKITNGLKAFFINANTKEHTKVNDAVGEKRLDLKDDMRIADKTYKKEETKTKILIQGSKKSLVMQNGNFRRFCPPKAVTMDP